MVVICPFSESGCNWEGKVEDYQLHADSCIFAIVQCEYCGEKSTKDKFKVHLQTCSSVRRDCPLSLLGCSKSSMNREELRKHLQECQIEHFTFLVNNLKAVEKVIDHRGKEKSKPTRGQVKLEQQNLQFVGWSLDDIELDGVQSRVLNCFGAIGKSKTQVIAHLEDAETSELTELKTDRIMRAELESLMSKHLAKLQKEVVERLIKEKDEEIAELKNTIAKMEKTLRLKNAEHEDRDFRLSLIENGNHDGTMIWKIPQFSKRKADAVNGKYTSIFSLPFYTGRYGYKMCLRLYIMGDGIGKGTHLSLFFVVMRGEFDNILQWPFTHKVTFKLINQSGGRDIVDTFQPDPMSSSFRKPKSDMNIASGCPRFVSHTELERGGFIVDDTIFVKCLIDTSTIRHP